jgi:A-kinase anchor protein 10
LSFSICPSEDVSEFNAEALRIYTTYISPESPHHIRLSQEDIHLIEAGISPESGPVSRQCFDLAEAACFHALETHTFQPFLRSEEYNRFLLSVLTAEDITLDDIAFNDTTFMVFMENLEREGASLLLQFWLAASNFRSQIEQGDSQPSLLQEDADVICRRFFQADSPQALSIDPFTRDETIHLVQSAATVGHVCFLRPEHLVFVALQKFFVPNFLHSDIYYKFLNGLSPPCLFVPHVTI